MSEYPSHTTRRRYQLIRRPRQAQPGATKNRPLKAISPSIFLFSLVSCLPHKSRQL